MGVRRVFGFICRCEVGWGCLEGVGMGMWWFVLSESVVCLLEVKTTFLDLV